MPASLIDIDFKRAEGTGSTGRILFTPPRLRVGSQMLSRYTVPIRIKNGKAKVGLEHLPSGTYHVREEIDGKPAFEFDFALPLGSAEVIQYEGITPVSSVPTVYTVVRTINDVAPNPTTGNIVVETGGTGEIYLEDLMDVSLFTPADGNVLVFDFANDLWENRHLDVQDIQGLASALSTKASSVHTHTVSQITDFEDSVEEIAQLIVDDRALPNRILRVKDKSKQGAGDTYNLPDTGGNWVLFAGGPVEYVIQANVGDDINLDYDFQMDQHATAVMDFAVVDAAGFLVRYLGSGTSTPTYDGLPGIYPASERFQGLSGLTGLTVEADDIDGGFVRLQWAIKTSADNGKIYANNNSPLSIRVVNTRLSGL